MTSIPEPTASSREVIEVEGVVSEVQMRTRLGELFALKPCYRNPYPSPSCTQAVLVDSLRQCWCADEVERGLTVQSKNQPISFLAHQHERIETRKRQTEDRAVRQRRRLINQSS